MAVSSILEQLASKYESSYGEAKAANLERYTEAKNLHEQLTQMFAPGGAFGQGMIADIEGTKKRDVASGAQSLVSSGLYGTTTTAGLGKQWEADVGQAARLKAADVRMGRYGEAVQAKAGMIERREDTYPDTNRYAQYMQQAAQAPAQQTQRVKRPSYTLPRTVGPSWMGFTR